MPSNPASFIRKLFPTSRRLLVERDLSSFEPVCETMLVVGAGHDPYKGWASVDHVIRLDISDFPGSIDVVGDAHCLPIQNNSTDTVLAIEVIEHLHSPREFILECLRVLKPGGQLVFSIPYIFHEHGDPYDFQRLSAGGLKYLLSDFSSYEIKRQGNRINSISDIFTTSSVLGYRPFIPLRIFNHLLVRLAMNKSTSTAPSGFFVKAIK